ncbi:MAG: hypothetical protein PVF58_08525 [Candidatus Methanofastidiosia archaeon]|jgi:hypothetical protein
MKKRHAVVIAVTSVVMVSLVAASVMATTGTYAPLYHFRMERLSNKMSFFPSQLNPFSYTAEDGSTLNFCAQGCGGGVTPLSTYPNTSCPPECDPTESDTCELTCWSTCPYTCSSTCNSTCSQTCSGTCETCENTCYCVPTSDPYHEYMTCKDTKYAG